MDRFAAELDAQDVRLKALPFALGAADEEIAQELHLDLLEAGAATTLAAAAAGVEGERARGQALRHRFRQRGEKLAHSIVEAEVEDRASNAACARAAIDRPSRHRRSDARR